MAKAFRENYSNKPMLLGGSLARKTAMYLNARQGQAEYGVHARDLHMGARPAHLLPRPLSHIAKAAQEIPGAIYSNDPSIDPTPGAGEVTLYWLPDQVSGTQLDKQREDTVLVFNMGGRIPIGSWVRIAEDSWGVFWVEQELRPHPQLFIEFMLDEDLSVFDQYTNGTLHAQGQHGPGYEDDVELVDGAITLQNPFDRTVGGVSRYIFWGQKGNSGVACWARSIVNLTGEILGHVYLIYNLVCPDLEESSQSTSSGGSSASSQSTTSGGSSASSASSSSSGNPSSASSASSRSTSSQSESSESSLSTTSRSSLSSISSQSSSSASSSTSLSSPSSASSQSESSLSTASSSSSATSLSSQSAATAPPPPPP